MTAEAWAALLPHLGHTGAEDVEVFDQALAWEVAYEVLVAANYLGMDAVQAAAAEFLKPHVTKANFLTIFNTAKNRGIESLAAFITSTIIQPQERMRRRVFGEFDLVLRLDQLRYRCHRAVVATASSAVRDHLRTEQRCMAELDVKVLGVGGEQVAALHSVLESLYLGSPPSTLGTPLEEDLGLLRLLADLGLPPAVAAPVLAGLAAKVTPDTLATVYAASCTPHHPALRQFALAYLVRHTDALERLLVELPREEVEEVLAHDWLEVEEEARVAELCLAWLAAHQEEEGLLAGVVRWSLLPPGERQVVLGKVGRWRGEVEAELARGKVERVREWPRLLVVVEKPGEEAEDFDFEFAIRAYDFTSKRWSVLSNVPHHHGWREGWAATALGDSVLLTSSNSGHPYLPVACLLYSLDSDSWGASAASPSASDALDLPKDRERKNMAEHSTAVLGGEVYTVLAPRGEEEAGVLALHHGVPGQAWTVVPGPQPATCHAPALVSVGGSLALVQGARCTAAAPHLLTYTPGGGAAAWQRRQMLGAPRGWKDGGWGGHGGGIVCVGGGEGGEAVTSWELRGGEGRGLGRLGRGRDLPGVGLCRGLLWVAGGQGHGQGEVVDAVEYYTEETDTWSTLAAAPGLTHPAVAVIELRKPLRLIDIPAMFPRRAK